MEAVTWPGRDPCAPLPRADRSLSHNHDHRRTSTHSTHTQHHLNNSRSQRILWLLEELEIPYEIKHYQRGHDQLAPKELREVHPLGKSPVITDTDRNEVVAESGAIIGTYARG